MDLRNEITQIVYVSALEEYAIQLFKIVPWIFNKTNQTGRY